MSITSNFMPPHSKVSAAFGTRPEPVHALSPRWDLGRYICGFHWNSPEGLRSVLRDALGVG